MTRPSGFPAGRSDLRDGLRGWRGARLGWRPVAAVVAALAVAQAIGLARQIGPQGYPIGELGLPAGVLLLGVVYGGLHAMLAMGLVVLYRAGRFLSFAQGQLGALAAVTGLAFSQHFEVPLGIGVLIALLTAVVVGALSELLVVRRLFDAPRLLVTVATIGLAQVYATLTLIVPALLDRNLTNVVRPDLGLSFYVAPIQFGGGEVVAIVVVPLVCVGLGLLFRTQLGTAIRATAENPSYVRLLGISVRRVSTLTWVLAGLLAATTGLLRATTQGFAYGSVEGPSILLPALAAAVIGGTTSLAGTFTAAIAIGVLEQTALWYTQDSGTSSLVVLTALLIGLGARRARTGRARDVEEATGFVVVRPARPIPSRLAVLPEVRAARWGGAVALLVAVAALPLWLSASRLQLATTVLISGLVAVSLTILTGWGGQVSLGQWGVVAVGAGVGALLSSERWDFVGALVLCGALGALLAVLLGLPALRLPGPLLAVTTLGFAVAVDRWFSTLDVLQQRTALRPLLFSTFDLRPDGAYFELCLVVLVLAVLGARRIRRAPAGLALIAARDNPRAAAAMGIAPLRARLGAFALSGALACSAGFLYAVQVGDLAPSYADSSRSLAVFTVVVIGGLGSLPGALLGTAYVLGVQSYLPGTFQPLATGFGLLLLVLALPEGLGGLALRGRDALLRVAARRRGLLLPSQARDAVKEAA